MRRDGCNLSVSAVSCVHSSASALSNTKCPLMHSHTRNDTSVSLVILARQRKEVKRIRIEECAKD